MRQRARWLGVSLASTAGFGLIYGLLVRTGLGQRFDEWSGGIVRALLPGAAGEALSELARPGALVAAAFAFLLLIPWALAGGRWLDTVAGLIVVLVSAPLALELRSACTRPELGLGGYTQNTFPSTHAAAGFALIVGALFLWPVPTRPLHLVLAAVLAVLIAAGNVTSYAHRPADVLGSLLLVGTVTGLVSAVTGSRPGSGGREQ